MQLEQRFRFYCQERKPVGRVLQGTQILQWLFVWSVTSFDRPFRILGNSKPRSDFCLKPCLGPNLMN